MFGSTSPACQVNRLPRSLRQHLIYLRIRLMTRDPQLNPSPEITIVETTNVRSLFSKDGASFFNRLRRMVRFEIDQIPLVVFHPVKEIFWCPIKTMGNTANRELGERTELSLAFNEGVLMQMSAENDGALLSEQIHEPLPPHSL